MSLKVTGQSKTYPNGVKALKGLTLTLGKHMFGLLGPNGTGKSRRLLNFGTASQMLWSPLFCTTTKQ